MAVSEEKKTRITIDLRPALYERLESLETAVGASSKADVIREALRLYEFLVQKSVAGYKFVLKKGDEEETVILFSMHDAEEPKSSRP